MVYCMVCKIIDVKSYGSDYRYGKLVVDSVVFARAESTHKASSSTGQCVPHSSQ